MGVDQGRNGSFLASRERVWRVSQVTHRLRDWVWHLWRARVALALWGCGSEASTGAGRDAWQRGSPT